jgi:hypothetical protein
MRALCLCKGEIEIREAVSVPSSLVLKSRFPEREALIGREQAEHRRAITATHYVPRPALRTLHRWHGCRRLASARAWRRSSCAQLSTTPGSGPLESKDLQVQHSATWSSVIIAFDQRRQLGFAISDTARPADSPVWETKKLSACILDSLILVRSETPNRQRSMGWGTITNRLNGPATECDNVHAQ